MIDAKNYIREKLQEFDPELDIREGSVFSDFFIGPLSTILSPYDNNHNEIVKILGVSNPTDMSEGYLDAVGASLLTTRNAGTKAIGSVYFKFNKPTSFIIPEGTQIRDKNTGLVFTFGNTYTITRAQMENDLTNYPSYVVGPFAVSADDYGELYNIPEGSAFSLLSNLNTVPSSIYNTGAFTGGINLESNQDYYERIKLNVFGNTLASPASIRNVLTTNFSDLVDTVIVGNKHPDMIRDIVYSVSGLNNFKSSNYLYTYSGQHSASYDNKNIAYEKVFIDVDQSAAIEVPAPDFFVKEFTDNKYKGLYSKDDLNYAETQLEVFIDETFENFTSELSTLAGTNDWEIHDGIAVNNAIQSTDEIVVTGGRLRLGKTKALTTTTTLPVTYNDLVYLQGVLSSTTPEEQAQALTLVTQYTDTTSYNNMSPIFHKKLDQNLGVKVTVYASTTDMTEDGEMCYITLFRDSTEFLAHDGYGIAWRKQPQYLIRMEANSYTDLDLKAADIARFEEEYIDFGAGTNYLGAIKNDTDLLKYNVFLVDNSALQEEVWIGANQVIDGTNGKNNFLFGAKAWLVPNQTYKFILTVDEQFGTIISIDDVTLINKGTSYPKYTSVNTTLQGYTENVTNDHFGVAVDQTKNYEWYIDSIKVESIAESFAAHNFSVNISEFVEGTDTLYYQYYGVGYDKNLYVSPSTSGYSSVTLAIYNNTTQVWDILGTSTSTLYYAPSNEIAISGTLTSWSDYELNSTINFAAYASNSGPSFANNTDHTLRTYYFALDNGEVQGVHKGNATDIYCHDPNNVSLSTSVFTVTGNLISLNTADLYIQEILEVREYYTKTVFDKTEYLIVNNNPGTSYSGTADYSIVFQNETFSGALIEVVFRQWTKGASVNSVITSSESRYPNADYEVKIMPPTVVVIDSLEYSGGVSAAEMKEAIKEYINKTAYGAFDKSDLINLLYLNGANYVNLNMDIKFRSYSTTMELTETDFTEQRVSLDTTTSRFFTELTELTGVTKL